MTEWVVQHKQLVHRSEIERGDPRSVCCEHQYRLAVFSVVFRPHRIFASRQLVLAEESWSSKLGRSFGTLKVVDSYNVNAAIASSRHE